MLEVPTLETARLVLRAPQAADAQAVSNFLAARADNRWSGLAPPATPEDLAAWTRYITTRPADSPNADVWWLLHLQGHAEPIGLCVVHGWNGVWRSALLGYELAQEFTGHGYMFEAVNRVLHVVYGAMNVHHLGVQIHPNNTASLRLAERLGFNYEGRLREIAEWDGVRHDLLQMSLLAGEFSAAVPPDSFPVIGMVGVDGPGAVELLDQ